jgi:hypothetical protein
MQLVEYNAFTAISAEFSYPGRVPRGDLALYEFSRRKKLHF